MYFCPVGRVTVVSVNFEEIFEFVTMILCLQLIIIPTPICFSILIKENLLFDESVTKDCPIVVLQIE